MVNRLGGGKLRSSVVSYLDNHVSCLLTAGSCREETGRQLAAACGELSQLAGWVAYDSDEHGLAQRYLARAEQTFDRAAREDDPAWLSYFDEAYLAARMAQCFRDSARQATPPATPAAHWTWTAASCP